MHTVHTIAVWHWYYLLSLPLHHPPLAECDSSQAACVATFEMEPRSNSLMPVTVFTLTDSLLWSAFTVHLQSETAWICSAETLRSFGESWWGKKKKNIPGPEGFCFRTTVQCSWSSDSKESTCLSELRAEIFCSYWWFSGCHESSRIVLHIYFSLGKLFQLGRLK